MACVFLSLSVPNLLKQARITHVQRQVQAQHITRRQQLLEANILRSTRKLLAQLRAVVVLHRHSERLSLDLEITSDAAHTEDTEDLALGVVAEGWVGVTLPGAGAQGDHAGVEVAQGAKDQEHVCVGGGIVDG